MTQQDPTLAIGLTSLTDYAVGIPLIDIMKMSRPMFAYNTGFADMSHLDIVNDGALDADGWPMTIPTGMVGYRVLWAFPEGTPGLEGDWVLTWEGEGTIVVGNVVSTEDHRIVFTYTGGNFWFNITATDPNETGDYIRNMKVMHTAHEALYSIGEIFNPDWLAVIQNARQLRFMDWQNTNGSLECEWADRPKLTDATWVGSIEGISSIMYRSEVSPFTVGEVITGGTHASTATVLKVYDFGTYGLLVIRDVSNFYSAGEAITGSLGGSATVVNGHQNAAFGGIPVEVMVALANKTGTDPWFNMPQMATDEYVTGFATYVRDNLNPELVATVEYSNETWNFSFSSYAYLSTVAHADWGDPHGTPGGVAWIEYSARNSVKHALLWNAVFDTEASTRLYFAMNVQMGYYDLAEFQIDATGWQSAKPLEYVAPDTVIDAIAITTYFGGTHITDETLRDEFLTAIGMGDEYATDWLYTSMQDPDVDFSIPDCEARYVQFRGLANEHTMDLVAYEGGTHMLHSAFVGGISGEDLATITTFLAEFSYGQRMADLYRDQWDNWLEYGDGPFMQFGDVAAPTQYGAFAMMRDLDDADNPRAAYLLARNLSETAWFGDGGGTRYIPQTIKAANDERVIVNEKGGMVSGNTGHEIVAIEGDRGDYTRVRDENGTYTLTKSGFDLKITGVEVVQFLGG